MHVPPLQVSPPAVLHAWLHSPQLALSDLRSRQMPSPPQSGRWSVHSHAELTHVLNCSHANAAPQPPQFARSVVVSTQTPLQSVVFAGHSHLPATQVVPPLQAISQPPQFWLSVCASTQDAPHLVRAASHVAVQLPRLQTWPALHATAPHAPQCCGSLWRSMQTPLQFVSGAGHSHCALLQAMRSSLHALPHAPQLLGSFVSLTHEPPQSTFPLELLPPSLFGEPLPTAHAPSRQTSPFAHLVPHAPQLSRSTVTSVHWPLQSSWPAAHPQVPLTQDVPPIHAVPHAPQLALSLFASTHELLQFVRPGAHPAAHVP